MLWIDKHQPKDLEDLSCHPDLTDLLRKVASSKNVPHMIFYGKSGAGKKTRIMALLRAIFGEKVSRIKAESIRPEGTSTEFVCCSSMYHNQISATELGTKDRICVQYLIKQLAAQAPATCFAVTGPTAVPRYRVFVIQEAEHLSHEAQAGLRRTLEKYVKNARIILHCQQLSSIMPPLKSRCLCVRVPLPTPDEITTVLTTISQREALTLPDGYIATLVNQSGRNLRRAILMLETAAMTKFPPHANLKLPWQRTCEEIVEKILKNQGLRCLVESRELLYEMLTALIPGSLILETLLELLIASTPSPSLKHDYIRAASHYAYTMRVGAKDVWHLEAFVAQCMSFYKRHAMGATGH